MKAFTIPSIFTAIDKLTAPLRAMSRSVSGFARNAEVAVAKHERLFRRLTPAFSETTKQIMSFASSAVIAAGIIGGITFSARSLMDYENQLANLKSLTGATDIEFQKFKSQIKDVAGQTKTSAVDVAKAFTAIANNQPELLKNADALAAVTKSSIILAQASKMELQPAGEALTQILNQFNKGASDAAKTIDILAAGSIAGSSEIRDTADAIQRFGTVAANAGIKIDESVALIEMASKFEKGSEAGSKLRNILITMGSAKVLDPNALKDMRRLGVDLNVVTNKAIPLNERLQEMSKVSKDNAALFHIFGKENQAMAAGILNSAGNFNQFVEAVNKNGAAADMAAINNKTLSVSIQQLKDKFVTWLVTSDEAAKGLEILRKGAIFLADNFSTIIKVVGFTVGAFAVWKAGILLTNGALWLYNTATTALTAAQWLLNIAMDANPIGLIILGIAALVGVIALVIKKYDDWGAALTFVLGPLSWIINLIQSFRRNWDMIVQAFKSDGIIGGLKAIGATLLDAVLMPLQQVFKLLSHLPGFLGGNLAASAMQGIEHFREKLGVQTEESKTAKPVVSSKTEVQREMVQSSVETKNKQVTVDFKNVPAGTQISGNGLESVMGKVSSTLPSK
ncbi:MAG: phage tail tape measure protein [Chitinophagales bacterium]